MNEYTYPPELEATPAPFQIGDRVQFNAYALSILNPAFVPVTVGTIISPVKPGSLVFRVRFDNGDIATLAASYFEKLPQEKSPVAV
ncbi:MAG: hypothetical protein AAF609_08470 [Cyanobacteria bacterium P01_C01_bin.120]